MKQKRMDIRDNSKYSWAMHLIFCRISVQFGFFSDEEDNRQEKLEARKRNDL